MKDSTQELASCVCNYAQVRGCWAVYLGLGFEARKEGREERRKKGEGEGGKKREAVKLEKIWLFYARLLH